MEGRRTGRSLDADEWNDDAAEAVHEDVLAKDGVRATRPVRDAVKGQGMNAMMISALKITAEKIALDGEWRRMMLKRPSRIRRREHRRENREILGDIVRDRERREAPRVISTACRFRRFRSVSSDPNQGRPCCGLFSSLRSRVHRYADVGLSKGRRVVRSVTRHRDETPGGLLASDQLHLRFGRGLRKEIIDPRFTWRSRGGQRIVAGNHDRANAHRT